MTRLRGNDGFTLVETLVAFTVMAMLLSVLFRGVVMMRSGSVAFDERTHEELVARAVWNVALADKELRNGTTSGVRDGRHWTLVAKPFDVSAQLGTTSAVARPQNPFSQSTGITAATAKLVAAGAAWTPQRLVMRLETHGRPIEIETIRLVRTP